MTRAPEGAVADAFGRFPAAVRARLLELRELILETAESTEGVGRIEETLKWGEPAYLTLETGSGSTVRIAPFRKSAAEFGLYFNCQTSLVGSFRQWFPEDLRFEGNRAIVFRVEDPIPEDMVRKCVAAALTYHLRKRAR